MNSPYDGPDTDVDVSIEINGVTHSASVHVFADTYFYSIYPEYYDKSILLGQRFMNTVFASPKLNEICTKHELSSLVKYNVEIVDGQQFGHLIDPTTKNRVSSLINLNHDNGKLDFEFSADSFDVNGTNNVVLKISTNKATIEPFNVTYHVARAKIQVTFSPPTLAPGDTAKVILKKINDDGTLSDFPADKYFDAQITDGKDYGTFISPESSDTLDQLLCVYQGFKFIANKKIPASQVQSTIIVNTTLFTASKIIPGKDGLNKNVSTVNKSMSKLKKTTSTKDDEQLWGMGTVSIVNSGGDCLKYPCITKDNPISPQIGYNEQPLDISYCQDNKNRRGGFIGLFGTNKLIQSYNINVCYNSNFDQWQFRINDNNKILFNHQFGICNENLKNMYPKPLFSIEDVEQIPIDKKTVYQAWCDFEKQRNYGASGKIYFIVDVTRTHESIHRQDYEKMIDSVFIAWGIDKKFLAIRMKCSEMNKIADVKKQFSKQIEDLLKDFSKKLLDQWLSIIGVNGTRENTSYEKKTQKKQEVLDVIQLYISYLGQLSHIAFPIGGLKCD